MKTNFILSSFTLLLFVLLAGGSDDESSSFLGIAILVTIIVIIIAAFIQDSVQSKNKKTRLEMIKQNESTNGDFDCSVKFGNDRCMFYFDSEKKQVMVLRVMTEEMRKSFVDGFEFSGRQFCYQNDPYFCIYDTKNRQLLFGNYENIGVQITTKNLLADDKNGDVISCNSIQAKLIRHEITKFITGVTKYDNDYTLIDECHGMIAVVKNDKLSSVFNYVDRKNIIKKTGEKPFVNYSSVGNYQFIMDEFFNILVVITPASYEIFNYSDIIEVSYEENGNQLYSKSALRTVGGAIVGGALMGGAGAVVGGLSGATKKNMEVQNMDIKILLRSTERTTCVLQFNDSNRVLKTKNSTDSKLYEKYQKNANKAKDLLSVIIDKVKQETTVAMSQNVSQSNNTSSVADELSKLVNLKNTGVLTDEEFNAQKSKLLNS